MLYMICTLRWQGTCFIYSVLSGGKVHALYILYSQLARYMIYIFCTLRCQGTCFIYSVLSGCKVPALYILYSQVARSICSKYSYSQVETYMHYIFYTFRLQGVCSMYSILLGYKVYALCIPYSQVTRYNGGK